MENLYAIICNANVQLIYLIRIFVSGLVGVLVGIERTKRQKEAGLRTHFIVSASACLITVVSIEFGEVGDGARIAAQIVTGIGFLGAGLIMVKREAVHGLTTAAGIWGTAGIGMAIGTGLYIIGIGTGILFVVSQYILHFHFVKVKAPYYLFRINFAYTEKVNNKLREYFKFADYEKFRATQNGEEIFVDAIIKTNDYHSEYCLVEVLEKIEGISLIEKLER